MQRPVIWGIPRSKESIPFTPEMSQHVTTIHQKIIKPAQHIQNPEVLAGISCGSLDGLWAHFP